MSDLTAQLIAEITSLQARVAHLERLEQLRYVPLATGLTSTSWDGDAKTALGNTGVLDLSVVFGAPAGIKAVQFYFEVSDTTGAPASIMAVGPSNGEWAWSSWQPVAGQTYGGCFVSPCDANGDVYVAFFHDYDSVRLVIRGYWI